MLTFEVGSLYSGKVGWTKASPLAEITGFSCLVVESVFFSGVAFTISLFSLTYFLTGVVLFSLYSGKAGWTNGSPLAVTTLFTVVAESVWFTFLSWCLPNTFLTASFTTLSTSFGAPTAERLTRESGLTLCVVLLFTVEVDLLTLLTTGLATVLFATVVGLTVLFMTGNGLDTFCLTVILTELTGIILSLNLLNVLFLLFISLITPVYAFLTEVISKIFLFIVSVLALLLYKVNSSLSFVA